MPEKKLFKIHVKGYVQGVGFRWSAVREAKIRGIRGIVKNMPDGSVYIEAEGSAEQLKGFIDWCNRGPDFGHVDSVTVDEYPPVDYRDFSIEY